MRVLLSPGLLRQAAAAGLLASILLLAACKEGRASSDGKPQEKKIRVQVATVSARREPVTIEATGSFIAVESSQLMPAVEGLVAKAPPALGSLVAAGAALVVLEQAGPQRRVEEAEAREQEAEAALAQAEARLGAAQGNADGAPEVQAAKAEVAVAEAEARGAHSEAMRSARLLATGDVSRSSDERAQTSLATAEARVASARQNLETSRNTARQSRSAAAGARAALAAAKSQTLIARKALADATVRAPFSGFITERSISAGEYVTTSSKLLRLDRMQPIKLQLQLPESRMARICPGQIVQVTVPAFGAERFSGSVAVVNAAVNPTARTAIVEAVFPNRDLRLKPGMFAQAAIDLGMKETRLAIPEEALQEDNRTDTFRVWVADGDTARVRIVQPARKDGGDWLLLPTGLREGERVILSDRDKLTDGLAVTIR